MIIWLQTVVNTFAQSLQCGWMHPKEVEVLEVWDLPEVKCKLHRVVLWTGYPAILECTFTFYLHKTKIKNKMLPAASVAGL